MYGLVYSPSSIHGRFHRYHMTMMWMYIYNNGNLGQVNVEEWKVPRLFGFQVGSRVRWILWLRLRQSRLDEGIVSTSNWLLCMIYLS